ncbi:hypothetical protein HDC94_001230 [Leifsonia sp. AK011]|uniref:HNH endonuclease signature motif containing protein n=1 Tax=Leifsonia sp. AK011 TaxID=2723075 RepID=UPI0015C7B7DA|nr:HNH endonuclease signature motif containing protein [Leifsonia sp. AK011]NYF10074.1 hypothetical protein [Leifsonia sp. AK011]
MPVVELPALRAFSREDAARLGDDDLLAEQAAFAAARRLVDAGAAAVAAEIAERSRRELGAAGLAQSRGERTPESLVARMTGLSKRDAGTLVRIGALVSEPAPWLKTVAVAVGDGRLSLEGADVVRAGLGAPGAVAEGDLARAATVLVESAPGLTLDELAMRARRVRSELDVAGVPAREEELRERRFLSLTPQPDGMTRISGLLDPESAAVVSGAIDAATSPRRGGPRFVDPSAAPAGSDTEDSRTIPQLLADALVDIVALATRADRGAVFGARRVGVRVHVAGKDLRAGVGFAQLEGQTQLVSVETAARVACDAGIVPVEFDSDGRVLNVGRTQRHHTPRMRVALAARDGGCLFPGCGRPPEWCEAHHTKEWFRDDGETSVDDGVLLCRHHHRVVHNRHWRIVREGTVYWLDRGDGDRTVLEHNNPILPRL